MKKHWNRFLDTLSFMTTIRVRAGGFDPEFHRSAVFFPTVGLVLGILCEIVWRIALPIFGDFAAAVMTVSALVILTGGLHLDGLGDTFDGVYSYRSKERILEIMKDSRVGTNALLVVVLVLLLKIGATVRLAQWQVPFILCMPIAGRMISLFSCAFGTPAKAEGSANSFIGRIERTDLILGLSSGILYLTVIALLWGDIFFLAANLGAVGIVILFALFYMRDMNRRIGGITGDVLGALCELSETIYLLSICVGVAVRCVYI